MRTASIAFSFSSITRKSSYTAHRNVGVLAAYVFSISARAGPRPPLPP